MNDLVVTKPASLLATERPERMQQQSRASKAERTWAAFGSDCIYMQPDLALRALKRWIEGGGIADATPVFRAVSNGGRLGTARRTDSSTARIVKARCGAAGVEAKEVLV